LYELVIDQQDLRTAHCKQPRIIPRGESLRDSSMKPPSPEARDRDRNREQGQRGRRGQAGRGRGGRGRGKPRERPWASQYAGIPSEMTGVLEF
jgi:hypothetical protein